MDINLVKVFKYIDKYQENMLDDLRKIISFKSISGSCEHQTEMHELIRWTESRLKSLRPNFCERFDIGNRTINGKIYKLPYVILASFGSDKTKKTVLIYCGMDVKDADVKCWTTNPWDLVKNNRDLVGRGAYKGKTQFISWLHVLEAYRKQDLPLPVNFKFIIEGMSQMNCIGLESLLWSERIRFLNDIDYICINDMEWLNSTNPCIGFGSCGICEYELICAEMRGDINPREVIDSIIKTFVDQDGNILIPKFNDDVLRITPQIENVIDSVECDLDLIKSKMPAYMKNWNKQKILLSLWQFPSFKADNDFVNTICSGFNVGDSVSGISKKLTFKIVHGQTPERCTADLQAHVTLILKSMFDERQFTTTSKVNSNTLKCTVSEKQIQVGTVILKTSLQSSPWQENTDSEHFLAAKRATNSEFRKRYFLKERSYWLRMFMKYLELNN